MQNTQSSSRHVGPCSDNGHGQRSTEQGSLRHGDHRCSPDSKLPLVVETTSPVRANGEGSSPPSTKYLDCRVFEPSIITIGSVAVPNLTALSLSSMSTITFVDRSMLKKRLTHDESTSTGKKKVKRALDVTSHWRNIQMICDTTTGKPFECKSKSDCRTHSTELGTFLLFSRQI